MLNKVPAPRKPHLPIWFDGSALGQAGLIGWLISWVGADVMR
jgi:hypothetical protein